MSHSWLAFWHDIWADTSQSSQNQHKAQGCIHCRQTVNHQFMLWLQGTWKLLYFILQFPFFSPPLLKVYSTKRALISLISGTPENNRKANPCANSPCFTAIFVYIKMWLVPVELAVLETDVNSAANKPARPLAPPDPHHGLRRQLALIDLHCFG